MERSEKQIANGLYDPITVIILDSDGQQVTSNYITPNKFARIMIGVNDLMVIESRDSVKKVDRKEVVICNYIVGEEIIIGIGEWKHGNVVTYYDFDADLYIGISYIIPVWMVNTYFIVHYLVYFLIVIFAITLGVIIGVKYIS
jgi:hypothetical protein